MLPFMFLSCLNEQYLFKSIADIILIDILDFMSDLQTYVQDDCKAQSVKMAFALSFHVLH